MYGRSPLYSDLRNLYSESYFVKIFDGDFMFSPFSQKTRCSLWLNDIIGQPLRAPTRSFTDFGAEGAEEEAMNSS